MRFQVRRYDTAEPVAVEIDKGRLLRLESLSLSNAGGENPVVANDLPWLIPGLVDLQVNGYGGAEFGSPEITVEQVRKVVEKMLDFGVTRFCPTVTTASAQVIEHGLSTIAAACDRNPFVIRHVIGIHLEGPYISREDGPRGAHPLAHCREPDWDEFQRFQAAAAGWIRLLTLSPEYPGAVAFIRRATASGVVVSIGHTNATGDQIRAAVDSGAKLSTHLGNGSHRSLRRHPNYLWDQLAEDRLSASLIVDGHHLPPEVVKTFVRAKGADRCILVSDLSGLAGLPPGQYGSGLCDLEILADGRLVLAGQDQLLAGASQPLLDGVENVMRFAGVDFRTAVAMASVHPAQLLDLPTPSFTVGEEADYVLLSRKKENGAIRKVAHFTARGNQAGSEL